MEKNKIKKQDIIKLIIIFTIIAILNEINFTNKPKTEEKKEKEAVATEELSLLEKTINNMSLEEKVGQLFVVRYSKEMTSKWTSLNPGGYLLFAKDFENHTKESIKNELTTLQEKQKYPLLIAVDEEGGYVTRVSRFKAFRDEKFASPKYYYETGGYELLEETMKVFGQAETVLPL